MNNDKMKGKAEQAKGSVKETAGKATGDRQMEREGKGDKAAGKMREAAGDVKQGVRKATS